MARIAAAPEILGDFERFLGDLTELETDELPARLAEIVQAVIVLSTSPWIGRPVAGRKRELVIGRGAWICVVLYRYVAEADTVFLLAVRGERDAGHGLEA